MHSETQGPADVLAFPLAKQLGKVRDVARKLRDKRTGPHADFYRTQVSEGLETRLRRVGISDNVIRAQLASFWMAVNIEITILAHREQLPGGAA